jgi:hypothetical protein
VEPGRRRVPGRLPLGVQVPSEIRLTICNRNRDGRRVSGTNLQGALIEVGKLLGFSLKAEARFRWLGWDFELVNGDGVMVALDDTLHEVVILHATPWEIDDPHSRMVLAFTEHRVPGLVLRLCFGLLSEGNMFVGDEE